MKKKEKQTGISATACQLRGSYASPYASLRGIVPLGSADERIYRQLREAIPLLDAAVLKLIRLSGGFKPVCQNQRAQKALEGFLKTVPCGRGQRGIESFLSGYMDSLLTVGRAVGEMVVAGGHLQAVCWADVTQLQVKEGENPLEVELYGPNEKGQLRALPYPHLLLFSTLNPEPEHPYGVSLFRGMPFLSDILLKIYHAIGTNWERAGNIRYSVICKAGQDMDAAQAAEQGQQVAREWARAMEDGKNGTVRDFVAVGDVQIKVIGADGPVLDSQVPVRQILEQLVAKTGLPPFLLGLSWSSTERMSKQQADLLTSELWAIRRAVEPILYRICKTYLALEGMDTRLEIQWEDITLQDTAEEAKAELYRAQAEKCRAETARIQ